MLEARLPKRQLSLKFDGREAQIETVCAGDSRQKAPPTYTRRPVEVSSLNVGRKCTLGHGFEPLADVGEAVFEALESVYAIYRYKLTCT